MQLKSTGVYASAPLQPGLQEPPAEELITHATGGPLLIGCFIDPQDEPCVMVVNRSFEESCTAEVTVADAVAAAEVSQETGQPLPTTPMVDGVLSVSLEPGEGRLFRLKGQ
ncbi:MAG: hypothetical protein IT445_00560 [Phycisphaeraceae bacterium]|nr:hypothetical protein [Phycisphaeraceae bacterium]